IPSRWRTACSRCWIGRRGTVPTSFVAMRSSTSASSRSGGVLKRYTATPWAGRRIISRTRSLCAQQEANLLPEARMHMVNPQLLRVLRCPVCRDQLEIGERSLTCQSCRRNYPVVLGIPDLRLYEDPLIPLEDDYRKGEKV